MMRITNPLQAEKNNITVPGEVTVNT